MAGSKYIQAYGTERVIELYENSAVPVWSIRCGKEFQFKGTGKNELEKMLEMLDEAQESTAYTLAMYERAESHVDIDSATGYSTAFNFKLCESPLERRNKRELSGSGISEQYSSRRMTEIETTQKRILELLETSEPAVEEKPKKQKLGAIGELLAHPAIMPVLPMIVTQIMNSLFKGSAAMPQMQPAYIPSVTGAAIGSITGTSDAERIARAVTILQENNPAFPEQLEKLAAIKQGSAATFQMIINALNQQ